MAVALLRGCITTYAQVHSFQLPIFANTLRQVAKVAKIAIT
jgi:hypothetical protein